MKLSNDMLDALEEVEEYQLEKMLDGYVRMVLYNYDMKVVGYIWFKDGRRLW